MPFPRRIAVFSLGLLAGCADDTCGEGGAPVTVGDRLLASLAFDGVTPSKQCGKLHAPTPQGGNQQSWASGSDGATTITPGSTIPFVASWQSGAAQSVLLSFAGSSFLELPIASADQNRGILSFPALTPIDLCQDLTTVCHSLKCCMQVVTPSGVYSAPVARQMILDCTGGVGCPPPYATPPGSCLLNDEPPPDLGANPGDAGPCGAGCPGSAPWCSPAGRCVVCLKNADCGPGHVCRAVGDSFACVPGCERDADCAGPSLACCNGACVDTARSVFACGGCGRSCAPVHGVGVCNQGVCEISECLAGYGDCDRSPANGCEQSLRGDPQNCGACGQVCSMPHAVAACAAFCYVAACEAGYDDCDSLPANGCETSVLDDTANCGACGYRCQAAPYAVMACRKAACMIGSCSVGHLDCDGKLLNGCEIDGQLDSVNCGACGHACPLGQSCISGACR